ncbi:glycoside hydrolase 43 family protein [Candidatus Sumerlaeota bacterium]|nr:glycoside hydrolase 43 family protein [Candidatus Sumerlaeota bacterium]
MKQSPNPAYAVWTADNGDGTYRNPILYADYSDPDVMRAGDSFYMTASSFNCVPGLPILHSRDLVNWRLIGHALDRLEPEAVFSAPQHGNGVWAPSIRYHDGEFRIYWGDPDYGIMLVKAQKPEGPWTKPLTVLPGKGLIDSCPFWDDDGQAYLIHAWAASRCGVKSLLTLRKMNPAGTQTIGEGVHVFDGHDQHHTVEGPKLYKRDGYYYIFAPAGGVEQGWQLALRSREIYGPYEARIVLAQGETGINGPHQGAWVETAHGESWFIHFQDKGAYGRIAHLQPVQWKNGWPVIGEGGQNGAPGLPVSSFKKPAIHDSAPSCAPATSDEFDQDALGLQWQWHANPAPYWMALMRGENRLRLFAVPRPRDAETFWKIPNLLLQKFPAPAFTVTTRMRLTPETNGKSAGLIVMGRDYARLSVTYDKDTFSLSLAICRGADRGEPEQIVEQCALQPTDQWRRSWTGCAATDWLQLRLQVAAPNAECRFSYSLDGEHYAAFDKKFIAASGVWIGAKVGLFCISAYGAPHGGYADFDWFRVSQSSTKIEGE